MSTASSRAAAIARNGSMVSVHRRCRATAMKYARGATQPSERLELVALARLYQRSMLAAMRRERELADQIRIAREQAA